MTMRRQRRVGHVAWSNEASERLVDGLGRLGLVLDSNRKRQLVAYAKLLLKWNQTFNLLGATTTESLIDDHLLDSLAPCALLREYLDGREGTLYDVGSGAGLPGIPLAIAGMPLPITLVEPIGKKAAFLRQAVSECAVSRTSVFEGRVEQLNQNREVAPCHFICRALSSLSNFVLWCQPLISEHSLLFAMKGGTVVREISDESQTDRNPIRILNMNTLLTTKAGVRRNLVVMSGPAGAAYAPPGTANRSAPLTTTIVRTLERRRLDWQSS